MRKPSPSMIVALLALFLAVGGVGIAATGGSFILGKANSATSTTSLSAPIGGKALQVSNTSTAAGATALGLTAAAGHAPFTVNTSVKVTNLNADKLDGVDSSSFARGRVSSNARFLPADTAGGFKPVLTETSGLPPFTIDFECPDDPSSGNAEIGFRNRSTSAFTNLSLWFQPPSFDIDPLHYGVAPGEHYQFFTDPNDQMGTFTLAWSDGHFATVWFSSFNSWNQPDPRNNGCWVQAMALSR